MKTMLEIIEQNQIRIMKAMNHKNKDFQPYLLQVLKVYYRMILRERLKIDRKQSKYDLERTAQNIADDMIFRYQVKLTGIVK